MKQIQAIQFLQMMKAGAELLSQNMDLVNRLNVFPVPDGDTGTNMSLTVSSGVKEMNKYANSQIGQMAGGLSKGLLMGARGNSGVILSQLFRGFAKALKDKETMNARQLADAFYQGVETAYKAVIKPVEGTVLTVAREAADAGMKVAWSAQDPVKVMEAVYTEANNTLARTPEMLSVLEETNVVDAGGQGLVYIYQGMLAALQGKEVETAPEQAPSPEFDSLSELAHEQYAGAHIDPASIEYGYCTEFIIQKNIDRRPVARFDETDFRQKLTQFGDSLLVVSDDELVKVHIHAETPGSVLDEAMKFGDLTGIKIDNMREQNKAVKQAKPQRPAASTDSPAKRYGVLVIAAGEGNAEVFRSLGADTVIEGGQTMNPSTEDIAAAIDQLPCEHVFVLPNNKNIILTAKQAGDLVDKSISVIETKTIPQGMAALFAFDAQAKLESNLQKMTTSMRSIRSGELTYAIRDTQLNGLKIRQGDYLGLADGEIRHTGKELDEVANALVAGLIDEAAEVVTLIYGQDVSNAQAERWKEALESAYPNIDFEVHEGGQPLYYYLVGVE